MVFCMSASGEENCTRNTYEYSRLLASLSYRLSLSMQVMRARFMAMESGRKGSADDFRPGMSARLIERVWPRSWQSFVFLRRQGL